MDILKLRINKMKNGNGLELTIDKVNTGGDQVEANEVHRAIIHPDLYNAVQELAPHLAIMAFHVKTVDDIAAPEKEIFDPFSVGSYSISGSDEKRGIIISGTLRKDGRAHNFNTPFYRFDEPPAARYSFMDDLEARLKNIEAEVAEYLNGTKRGEASQGKLDLPDEGAVTKMNFDQANPDAMAGVAQMKNTKKGRKKVVQTADAPSGEVVEEQP